MKSWVREVDPRLKTLSRAQLSMTGQVLSPLTYQEVTLHLESLVEESCPESLVEESCLEVSDWG